MRESLGVATFDVFVHAHAAVLRRIEEDVEAAGSMSVAWYDVLLTLERAPGRRLRMQELAEHVVLSRSRVSRIVDELERAGFVKREPCPDDRRVIHAAITRPGRVALRRARPVHLRSVEDHFASVLSAEELEALRAALERVTAASCATRTTRER
jgi:DNA-binding MarR family transcriptional regulator